MITVHTGKCYKALIHLGAAISLLRYSIYQNIEDSFKTPTQPTTPKLNTANGLTYDCLRHDRSMHLQMAEFKFTHNFVICDRLPDTGIIFGIDIQKKFSLSYTWDKREELLYTKGW